MLKKRLLGITIILFVLGNFFVALFIANSVAASESRARVSIFLSLKKNSCTSCLVRTKETLHFSGRKELGFD